MWVARNKDNSLRLFHNKPYRSSNEWKSKYEGESEFYLTEEDFSELKWEDEPIEVTLAKKTFQNSLCVKEYHFYLNKTLRKNKNYMQVIRSKIFNIPIIIDFEYKLDGITRIGTAYVDSLVCLDNVLEQIDNIYNVDSKR